MSITDSCSGDEASELSQLSNSQPRALGTPTTGEARLEGVWWARPRRQGPRACAPPPSPESAHICAGQARCPPDQLFSLSRGPGFWEPGQRSELFPSLSFFCRIEDCSGLPESAACSRVPCPPFGWPGGEDSWEPPFSLGMAIWALLIQQLLESTLL